MNKKYLPTIILILISVVLCEAVPQVSANLIFAAKLTGDQEGAPPVTTNAYGVASFVLNGNRDTMCIGVTARDLSSPITAAHIHFGSYGLSGPPVIDLLPFINGNRIAATLTGTMLTPSIVSDFIARRLYINIHTVNNPSGEIRGQIELETDYTFKAILDGSQTLPPGTSTAIGAATFSLHHDYMYTKLIAQFTGLSAPISSAKLHNGSFGTNGPEVATLDTFVNGNTLIAEIPNQLFIYDLLAGNIYINVSTSAYPTGEIRGQVLLQSDLAFDIWLNGAQETPPTPSSSSGCGSVTFSEWLDTVYFDVIFDTLTSSPTTADFHRGMMGVSGPPIVDVTTSMIGNHLSGMATGLSPDFISGCLLGEIYLNVHSSAFPAGEIRGQVRKNAYEGFTYTIDGSKETPPTTSSATGSGFVSIDPNRRSAHYRMVVNDLSGPLAGVHFHQGTPGNPGGIIFDLTPYFSTTVTNVSASNYWTDIDVAVPFDGNYADMFMNNNTYANFHTAMYPDGEVRGDIIQGAECFVITGLTSNSFAGGATISPLPATNIAYLDFSAYINADATLGIYDTRGRLISAAPLQIKEGENKTNINISNLIKGVYFVKLALPTGEQAFITKLLKQ